MSSLRSLFQPKWQHKNPEIREKAIGRLSDPDLLVKILCSDPEPAIRALALARIDDPNTLDKLIDNPGILPDSLFRQAAEQRLKQLMPSPETITTISQVEVLTRIATLSDDPEIIAGAIGQIPDQTQRLNIALNHESAKVRLLSAQGINESSLLKQLAEVSRGKDKALYRYCKTQLEQREAIEKRREQQQKQITLLIASARQLSLGADAPDYRTRYLGLQQQWQSLSTTVSATQQSWFHGYMETCAKHLARLTEAAALEQQLRQQVSRAQSIFASLIAEFERLEFPKFAQITKPDIKPLEDLLDGIDRRWRDASGTTSPTDAQTDHYNALQRNWRQALGTLKQLSESGAEVEKWLTKARTVDSKDYVRLQQLDNAATGLLKKLPWPETERHPRPDQLRLLARQHEQLKQAIAELSGRQKQHIDQLLALLDGLEEALAKNDSKKAESTHGRARQSLKAIDPSLRGNAEERLKNLGARLQEVNDWKGFALEPKKLELCRQMEALCDSTPDPETLADQIQILQNQWKHLGSLPDKRREQALWVQFKALSERAWKPCAEAFAQQAEVRKANYQARMNLVSQLKVYEQSIAWPDVQTSDEFPAAEIPATEIPATRDEREPALAEEGLERYEHTTSPRAKPDWPLVRQTLDSARAAFEQLTPVNKVDDQSSRRNFRKISDRIYSHIQAEYQRNIAAKEKLIEQANLLIAETDLDYATQQAKQLQARWNTVGLTPKSTDRKLWQAFRRACDGIFERLDEQKSKRRLEIDEKIKQAENLLKQAQALFSEDQEQTSARLVADIQHKVAEFNEIELPANVHARLRKQFSQLEKRAEEALTTLRRARDNAEWRCLINKIMACALRATDGEKAAELWTRPDRLPADIDLPTLEAYWQKGPTTAAEDACHEACISLEIAAGLDSPDEDKQVRMEVQMRRLVKGPGNKPAQYPSTPIDIANHFIALHPSEEWVRRFCRSLEKLSPGN